MKTVMIGYDLNRPGKNYTSLIEAIKKLGAWWHWLDSTWLIKSDAAPSAIRDALRPHIDANDELLVSVIDAPAAWVGFNSKASQ